MPPRLTFISGSRAGFSIEIGAEAVTFGRGPDQKVVFGPADVLASAEHAAVRNESGKVVLYDEGSSNGTFVNGEQVFRQVLAAGDIVQFGLGGPSARFAESPGTVEGVERTAEAVALRRTLPAVAMPGRWPMIRESREFLAATLQHVSRRMRQALIGITLGGLLAIGAVAAWQQRSRARLERALFALSTDLVAERASRAKLETDFTAVQSRYDSLRALMLRAPRQTATAGRRKTGEARDYMAGVALIVFAFGYAEREGTELLRYVVDGRGLPVGAPGPDGRFVPAIRFGGGGPPVVHEGTATGFLVDAAGLLLTNRHVAEPWAYEHELERMRAQGIDAAGRLLSLQAYFPPGEESFRLAVDALSDSADVAVMRILNGPVHAPVLPLARAGDAVRPGDQLRLIGYPTGVYNLLFRVDEAARHEIVDRIGQDSRKLLDELAGRRLIQPLVTSGSVSDTTGLEVIHTAATTVGGSGGPLFDDRQLVIAIQHASVVSPNSGDPFRTQRAVPIRFAWEILPRRTAAR
ncbi:MAG: trypsin-like peptidase domain-containing protein [Gemmatimonadetes bacterium]|nr:trypsin-like peptidase domain-containing protein [Gemmatimonadota bacterium]